MEALPGNWNSISLEFPGDYCTDNLSRKPMQGKALPREGVMMSPSKYLDLIGT